MNFSTEQNLPFRRTRYCDFHLIDGVMHVYYTTEIIDVNIARSVIYDRFKYVGDLVYPVVIDMGLINQYDEESLIYLSSEDAGKNITCCALLFSNEIQVFGYDLYMNYEKSVPFKIFHLNKKEEAINWLKKTHQESFNHISEIQEFKASF